MTEPVFASATMDLTWRYASGAALERLAEGLRAGRLQALRCDGCGRRYLPPRPVCGRCHRRLSRWVEVADVGTVEAWTVLHEPLLDARTSRPRPVPCGLALVRLDGADTTVNHFLAEADPARLRVGLRVRAVWREERRGAMDDILHFEALP